MGASPPPVTAEQVCLANIGARGRRLRRNVGLVAAAVGLLAAVLLELANVAAIVRLGLLVPFWVAGIGLFQAHDKT